MVSHYNFVFAFNDLYNLFKIETISSIGCFQTSFSSIYESQLNNQDQNLEEPQLAQQQLALICIDNFEQL